MTKRDKIVLGIIGAVLGVMLGAMLMPTVKKLATQAGNYLLDGMVAVYRKATYVAPVYYELTDEEKEWLIYAYGHEDRISEGLLSEREAKRLKISREGLAVLEEKYPGYQFKVTRVAHYSESTGFKVYEKNTGEIFLMEIKGDDESGYEVKDDFYGDLIADEVAAYIEEQFEKEGIEDISIRVAGVWKEGREYDINLTAEDVVGGRLKTWIILYVDIYAGDMSEEDCVEYAQIIEQIMNKIDLYGSCHLYFKDTTKEEMLVAGEKGETIYMYDFQSE